jgi:AcrR family transcriptional regulator
MAGGRQVPKIVDHTQRRMEIVEAAWRVIAERGIDEVTTRQIARQAGYSHGVLAHYFASKDAILLAALELSHERINERYEQQTRNASAWEALQAVLDDNLPEDDQRELETRVEMSFWERSLNNPELGGVQESESSRLQELLRGLLVGSQESEAVRRDLAVDDVLALLAALIDGLSLHVLLYPDRFPTGRASGLMASFLSLLTPTKDAVALNPHNS